MGLCCHLAVTKRRYCQGANYMVNSSGETYLTEIFFQDEIRVLYFNIIQC